ncbi:50S ribosomal protein L25/general stress protein Ctc [Metasolibacillus sp.]|uniref:50S ribosomal protein L25/general stress protein Ctc n=1 Tax=Metasolibacillus sp. TaxID=2703680 RepID=UPI0025D4DC14|nr:50S ribosomal protein L25/general stress protein Ctc [Metasolibacillus sp.]MCT6925237.1 50S ribosomal protein L25/general stress protein Ctc [Metasolibacillus sp.]MCT6941405.1 50S ribosomal protein L25/general stress protein Ctc [Metasolibacillus sp.]
MSTALTTNKRTKGQHSALTKLRQQGAIPGVVYGYQVESTPISIDAKKFAKALSDNGSNGVFQLELDGKKVNAVLSEVQRDALKGFVKHIDFQVINMSEDLEVNVPVITTGDSVGVAEGGLLLQPAREITIKVKPNAIPEAVEVDVTNLAIGSSLTVGDIRSQQTYDILNADEEVLVTVAAPAVEEEEPAEVEETTEEAEE